VTLVIVLILGLAGLFTLVVAGVLLAFRADMRDLRTRIERLELRGIIPQPEPVRTPEPAVMPPTPSIPPVAAVPPTPIAPAPSPVLAEMPAPTPALARTSSPAPVPTLQSIHSRGEARLDHGRLEQQIGGIWMQNAGSVLLLLGAFFLIVWGYANKRIGPEILVLAGVALGIVVAWRGHVIGRTLTALGNALIGIGLGVVYITLYLGHFRMHVFHGAVAFSLLTLTSLVSVGIGLRRREPIIATLGSLAAYLPQLLAVWIPLQGFRLALPALLGYFAVVNVVVFALAASVGWSGLALLSLVLTTVTWGANSGLAPWGLGVQLALSALYVALGLAPVVRLARDEKRVRGIDIAVITAAPMLLLIASFPFLIAPWRMRSGLLLAGLSVIYLGISLWVEKRRREQDLWRPLTAASTVFLAAGIERGLLPEYLALAWCAQGMALLWLGLGERGAWFRRLGYAILAVASVRLFFVFVIHQPQSFLGAPEIRDLIVILALVLASHLLGTARDRLDPEERYASGPWALIANLLLMIWIAREANQLQHVLPQLARPDLGFVKLALTSACWMIQCVVLLYLSIVRSGPVLRYIGYAVGACAAVGILISLAGTDWRPEFMYLLNTTAIVIAFATTLVILGAEFLARHRDRLGPSERVMPEVATSIANFILMVWIGREADHLRHVLPQLAQPGLGFATLALMSACWMIQCTVLLYLSVARNAPVLRYIGYVVGICAASGTLASLAGGDSWRAEFMPLLNTMAIVIALATTLMILGAEFLARHRDRLGPSERVMPEVATTIANFILLAWWAREAGHLASVVATPGERLGSTAPTARTLAAVFTSAAWTLQAVTLFALGWIRNSAFLRWSGLGLFGLTVLKFLLVDLDRVDTFWRFVSALGIGVALLVVSFLYQRRARRSSEEPAPRAEVG